jgi:phage gpG-like protein
LVNFLEAGGISTAWNGAAMGHNFTSFLDAAVHCGELALAMHEADKAALEKATKLLQRKVKEKFGEYQSEAGPFVAWAELAESTKQDRERQGYPEDEPLLREGTLRDSVERLVRDGEGFVGSNSDVAVYQELGTKNMPPRSTFGSAGVENMEAVIKIVGEETVIALVGEQVFEGRMEIE